MYGFCHLPAVPLRKEPSDASEMVSQLLFGEYFEILEVSEKWVSVRNRNDGYLGYLGSKQYVQASDAEAENPVETFVVNNVSEHISVNGVDTVVPMGSRVPVTNVSEIGTLEIRHELKMRRSSLFETAEKLLNSPYLWGGKTCMGIDCSGFTQTVFATQGIQLRRDASQQVLQGSPINSMELAQPGDLCFFDNPQGRIIHVGILLDGGRIIHASGCVRIDGIDENGIFNADIRKYTHHLAKIRRM